MLFVSQAFQIAILYSHYIKPVEWRIIMRSDAVFKGTQQAPHRSLFNALGLTEEEMNRPLIGIVSSYNEIVPGHMNIDKLVEAVKLGVAMAGWIFSRETGERFIREKRTREAEWRYFKRNAISLTAELSAFQTETARIPFVWA